MNSVERKMSSYSKALVALAGLLLAISIFVPIWRIDLDAPQYPEGLNLLIFSDHLGGNVDIINGLNHYIGMKTLHKEDFIEFTVLPYIIGLFSLFCFFVALLGKRKLLNILFSIFLLFGILAMYDFWRWEYDYGHNLDPNAAIIVPGMAYQPPLIGFKQLLNFGAFSIPAIGGWMFIASGLIILIAVLLEYKNKLIMNKLNIIILLITSSFLMVSCSTTNPEPIQLNKDNCAHCKMTIADIRFATELITKKGRIYKFDDLKCMLNYSKEYSLLNEAKFYVSDFGGKNNLIPIESLYFIQGSKLNSPMAGNVAAFYNKEMKDAIKTKLEANDIKWVDILTK